MGVRVTLGHAPENLEGADLVLYDTMDVLYLRRYLDAVFHMRCAPCFSLFTVERFHYTPYPGPVHRDLRGKGLNSLSKAPDMGYNGNVPQ